MYPQLKDTDHAYLRLCQQEVFYISSNRELNSLGKSFSLERLISIRETPWWDLMIVLRHLMRLPYEPLNLSSLANLTKKTAFFLTLASAKRNSEVNAFSSEVAFSHDHMSVTLSYLPGFFSQNCHTRSACNSLGPSDYPSPISLSWQGFTR